MSTTTIHDLLLDLSVVAAKLAGYAEEVVAQRDALLEENDRLRARIEAAQAVLAEAPQQQVFTPAERANILKGLRRSDQARIAEALGTVPEYVKQVLRYRTNAKSALAMRIWRTADQLLKDRQRLANIA